MKEKGEKSAEQCKMNGYHSVKKEGKKKREENAPEKMGNIE